MKALTSQRIGKSATALFAMGAITISLSSDSASASAQATSAFNVHAAQERAAIRYFIENANPISGLVRDAAENFAPNDEKNRVASMAASGFGLAVLANAAERNLIDRASAERLTLQTLRFSRDHVPRREGWFLHFVDWETGKRVSNSEFSTIDTALFLAGALYAGEEFGGESKSIANHLYEDVNFLDAMTDGGTRPDKRTLSMAWTPEEGFTPMQWDMFAEQMVLLVLGLGHPTRPLPVDTWLAWDRSSVDITKRAPFMGIDAALFLHQYSQLFLDMRRFDDGHPNYHENAAIATRLHRKVARADRQFQTLREGFWGFSAGQSPAGYEVWSPTRYRGVVCIGCTVGSAMYEPTTILADMTEWATGPRAGRIWGRYGFVDSIDFDRDWASTQVLGITVGPAYMSLANINENTSFWRKFMAIPAIQKGLERAASARRSTPANL